MDVIYSSSDSYANVMAISLVSLLESNSNADNITVHIISNGISEKNAAILCGIVERYGRRIEIVDLPDLNEIASVGIDFKQHNIATFARLFIVQLFPNLSRAIFVDCDTIIIGSLEELWKCELGADFACAGVKDAISKFNKRRIGLGADATYVNAGILLFDLDNWKRLRAFEKCMTFLGDRGGSVPLVDQGVLNGCMSGNIETLDMKYNVMTYAYVFNYKELQRYKKPCANYYTEKEYEEAKACPVVLHSTGSFLMDRAWHINSTHPYAGYWQSYAEKAGNIDSFEAAQPSWRDVFLRKVCSTSLRRPAIEALGILQSTIKG